MNIHAKPVLFYRWIAFLLAAGYSIYQITTADYSHTGGPFRHLTIWALLLSFYATSRMLALSEFRVLYDHRVTMMCAAVLNAMVVFLYWKLFFDAPENVNSNGPIVWHQQYYLHGLGPALQIFDALVIARAFRSPISAVPWLIVLIAAYVAWAEMFVQPLNEWPVGAVTSGLPYPFLNSLELSARLVFYGTNAAFALVLLAVFTGMMRLIDLWRRDHLQEAP